MIRAKRARLRDANERALTGVDIGRILGVPARTVQEWLNGTTRFPVDRLVELRRRLDVGPLRFLAWAETISNTYTGGRDG